MDLLLLSTSFLFILTAFRYLSEKSRIHKQSSLILGVAGIMYLIMAVVYNLDTSVNLRLYRYIDWFITVPIMVYQMDSLSSHESRYTLIYPELTSILMLGCGFLGESLLIDKTIAGICGVFLALFTFLPLFNQIDVRTNKIYYVLMIGWLFYPIVYFIPETFNIIILYSLVDLIVKIGFAGYLYKKIV